jgi:hypothetical protein
MKLFDFNNIEDVNKLLRYRRIMLWIVGACVFSSVSLASGVALGLAFGVRTIETIMLAVFCGIMFITVIPSIFFFVWIGKIESILIQRNVYFDYPIENRIQRWALKMMFWAILVVLLPMLIRRFTA